MTWITARNSAPSRRYSAASDAITTISESALLMGCRCAITLIAPAAQMIAKIVNSARWIMLYQGTNLAVPPNLASSSSERGFSPRGICCYLRCQRHYQAGNHDVRDRQRQQHLPAECH